MSKKLSKYQIGLAIVGVILAIIIMLLAKHSYKFGNMFSFDTSTSWGVVRMISYVIVIAMLVIGIIQIVKGAQESNGLGLAAGITGVLSFIPFVGIAALILNIIIVVKK